MIFCKFIFYCRSEDMSHPRRDLEFKVLVEGYGDLDGMRYSSAGEVGITKLQRDVGRFRPVSDHRYILTSETGRAFSTTC